MPTTQAPRLPSGVGPVAVVVLVDAFVVLSNPLFGKLAVRATGAGRWTGLNALYPWGMDSWELTSTACSVAVLLILHAAVAALATRGDTTAERLKSAAAPAFAAGPLVGLLA